MQQCNDTKKNNQSEFTEYLYMSLKDSYSAPSIPILTKIF